MFDISKLFKWRKQPTAETPKRTLSDLFQLKYTSFKELLDSNAQLAKIMSDISDKLHGYQPFGMSYVRSQTALLTFHTIRMIKNLNVLSGQRHMAFYQTLEKINAEINNVLREEEREDPPELVLPYALVNKEMADWVGGKNANLGEVRNRVGLPVPEGFAITTRAFRLFLDSNDLTDQINKYKVEMGDQDSESVHEGSEAIQRLIFTATVPSELEQAVLAAFDDLTATVPDSEAQPPQLRVSMRSSAIGEDSELSFAGQYVSVLNVTRDKLISTYKVIVASLFTPRAISYRFNKGIRVEDVAMSVACIRMVESIASGVMYSCDPLHPQENNIIITAVWGLGPYAVDGIVTPDTYKVAKDGRQTIIEEQISHKPVQLVINPLGGLMEVPVPSEKQDAPALSSDQIITLARYAQRLEEHYGGPQDMEWALDQEGNLIILQSRPLNFPQIEANIPSVQEIQGLEKYQLLLEGGNAAFPGVGYGLVYQIRSEDDLVSFPDGGVLVARHSSPKFVVLMSKAGAIITDFGSATGHMASLSREFEIPTILNAGEATKTLREGQEVTVDAYSCRVYEGRVPELLSLERIHKPKMKGTPVYETLKQLARFIVPLHLLDPTAPNFNAEYCETVHDIMRLVHELSYGEMFKLSDVVSEGGGGALQLKASLPLDLHVIDLGGGITGLTGKARKVTTDQIASIPFQALLAGMTDEQLSRQHEPKPIELRGFFSVVSQQMMAPPNLASERFGDRSYAIISDKYLNFSSRVGYHYSVLDAYCGETMNKNYITFTFKGGAADDVRKNRRCRAIAAILAELDFTVEAVEDRVGARLQKYQQNFIKHRLEAIGRLLLFTRQMDMLMSDEASIERVKNNFLIGNYGHDM
ncbi:MAG: phosphoenolpyruvate synthase [Deltaproteobacteria bacterium]|nr:phosphoenolpyruvate synthase [Deltaproteobacteria bacterium]